MRTLLATGLVLMAAGCAMEPQPAPVVSWQYGPSGDAVSPSGPPPVYSQSYGLGAGDTVTAGPAPTPSFAYGAEGQTNTTIQMSPQTRQNVAAPAPTPAPASTPRQDAPGPHI